MRKSVFTLLGIWMCAAAIGRGQSVIPCSLSATPTLLRQGGVAEQAGDILLTCSGPVAQAVSGSIAINVPVPVTNRLNATGGLDAVAELDTGAGFVPVPLQQSLLSPNIINFAGTLLPPTPAPIVRLRFRNIRVNVRDLPGTLTQVNAQFSVTTGSVASITLPQSTTVVGRVTNGLFGTVFGGLVSCRYVTPVPASRTLDAFVAAGIQGFTVRATEGFANSFLPRAGTETNGTRLKLDVTNIPGGVRVFAPALLAGSSAQQPTSLGAARLAASGGTYIAGPGGQLLLAQVSGTDANGAGGTAAALPAASGPVTLGDLTELPVNGGVATAIYEVADANSTRLETTQIPVFVVVPTPLNPSLNNVSLGSNLSFAPLSTVDTASATAPVPRFVPLPLENDCGVLNDCDAGYVPRLVINAPALIQFTTFQGSNLPLQRFFQVENPGGGVLAFSSTPRTTSGGNWLRTITDGGVAPYPVWVEAIPQGLAPGSYQGEILIDAGQSKATVPVQLTILPLPTPAQAQPTIGAVVSSAALSSDRIAAGSIATIFGTNLGLQPLTVTVEGQQAQVFFQGDSQINFLVPSSLAGRASANLSVRVRDLAVTRTLTLQPVAPAIFPDAIVDAQFRPVTAGNRTAPGNTATRSSFVVIYATGLDGAAISARVNDRVIANLPYAAAAPGLAGVQQINLQIPADLALTGTEADVQVCGVPAGSSSTDPNLATCSAKTRIAIRP